MIRDLEVQLVDHMDMGMQKTAIKIKSQHWHQNHKVLNQVALQDLEVVVVVEQVLVLAQVNLGMVDQIL